jgi:hypothetical protein
MWLSRLDDWLGDPAIRTHHRRSAAVAPDALWGAAQTVRLSDTRVLGRVVRWRLPGTPGDARFAELFRSYPFVVLDEGEHHLISGLAGRIWTLARDYPRIASPEQFAAWDEPGTVRVLFGHGIVPSSDGGSELVSEARVQPVDRRGALRLRAVWSVLGHFERLIGAEPLPVAVRRAEAGD